MEIKEIKDSDYPSCERKKFHLLTKTKQKYIPSNVIFYDSETVCKIDFKSKKVKNPVAIEYLHDTLELGYFEYWDNKQLDTEGFFYTKKEFFDFIYDTFLGLRKTLYIFAHNQAFDYRVSLDNKFFENDFDKVLSIIDSNVFILIYKHKVTKRKIIFLDSFNYLKTSIEKLGEQIGIEKVEIKDNEWGNVPIPKLKKRCMVDVQILRESIFELFNFVEENKIGTFKYTIAGLSLNAFRHSFMSDNIFIHANPEVHILERKSYFGGRTECFFIGEIKEPVKKLDINSAYPAEMLTKEFPTKLVRTLKNPDLDFVYNLKDKYLVIADVLVNTDKRYYPKKIDGKIVFPIGEFRTTLCSPELFYDYSNIKEIFSISIYEKGKIFKDYIDYFYNKRIEYKKLGNEIYTYFCKIFMNSLYGKFGQKNSIFERKKDFDKYYKDEGFHDIFINNEYFNIKFEDKKAFINIGNYECFNSFVAIASFVTSYARVNLLDYLLLNGFKVLYVDTDSLFVKSKHAEVYNKYLDNYKLGFLKVEDEGNELEIRTLKDYVFNGEEKIKGLPFKKAKKLNKKEIEVLIDEGKINISKDKIGNLENNVFKYTRFLGYRECFRYIDLDGVYKKEEIKVLKREYSKGNVNENGIVKPIELCENE